MAALVLGLLIGWLIEWVIDWFYWRRPAKQEPLDPPAPAPIAPPPPVVIQPAVESLPPVEAPKRTKKTLRIVRADNLKKIKGIGPAIEKRLNEAGVKKYEQLA
ncbi:MAG TPA: hypothetical protein PLE14_11550, partial [Anaerolineales bacterium]|nr:hypothetical protein [Anaerolineales bacterium]